jgi:2-(1,2-epoxy-1,2-dihydrophenyl)acetyl-CoA isomerase
MAEVETSLVESVLTITLNRPESYNAFTTSMHASLHAALEEAAAEDVRAVVITGAGKGFCAGQDLGEFKEVEHDIAEHLEATYHPTVRAIRGLEKPVIAAVNGAAAGAGMNLALGCDIRLASTAAKFTQAFVKRGLHPDWGGTYFLPRLVGMAKACELIFTGEIIDAQEALRLGIVNAVYAPEELMPAAYELARKIASGPPVAIRLAKRALYHSEETDLRGALEFETFAQNVCSETEDAREGIRAFVEKRAPLFKGR